MAPQLHSEQLPEHARVPRTIGYPLCVLLAVLVGCGERPPVTPRTASLPASDAQPVAFESPYLNTRPDVKYVGDAACAACHEDIAETYHRHPMGRSLAPIAAAERVEQLEDGARSSFVADGVRYEIVHTDSEVVHKQVRLDSEGNEVAAEDRQIAYAIGSGRQGRSYLIDRDGFLFQSPVTWYAGRGTWDLSPGYEKNNFGFHRPILEDCLFCHSNRAEAIEHTKNQYEAPIFMGHAIGCERCHGPGELHVRLHEAGDDSEDRSLTIVNPARLEPPLREAVCQQCHLSGAARVVRRDRSRYDFRPGLPLDSCFATYALRGELQKERHFVGQVEQMYESRCFQASAGKLGCISCHDPHVLPSDENRVAFYRERCLSCHASNGCSLPERARIEARGVDDCAACHMPVLQTDIQHASTTDHRIVRLAEAADDLAKRAERPRALRTDMRLPLVEFPPRASYTTDRYRDLGIALVEAALHHPEAITPDDFARVIPLLQEAVERYPDDLAAREALAHMHGRLGQPERAFRLYERVLAREPRREHSLTLRCSRLKQRASRSPARSSCT